MCRLPLAWKLPFSQESQGLWMSLREKIPKGIQVVQHGVERTQILSARASPREVGGIVRVPCYE